MKQQRPEKPGTWQAEIFVAYATEDRNAALAIQDAINKYAKDNNVDRKISVETWEVKVTPGTSILENLRSKIAESDFGVFIYSPDEQHEKARDNVVFETGLFMGMKGIDHAIILLPEGHEVAPSDLAGIVELRYSYDKLKNVGGNHSARIAELGGVCAEIVDRICVVMDQSAQHQEEPGPAQPASAIGKDQAQSAPEMFSTGLAYLAGLGSLRPLGGTILPGQFVVHSVNGVGRIVGFDTPDTDPRYIDVQFGSAIGRYRMSELFTAPTNSLNGRNS